MTGSFLIAMERALLRGPEIALPGKWYPEGVHICSSDLVCAAFFVGYNGTFSLASFKRVFAAVLNNAKSNTESTRASAVDLFKALFKSPVTSDSVSEESLALHTHAMTELLALPKASKSASAEHRVALYTMAESVPPGEKVSAVIQSHAEVLLSKETNDAALGAFCRALDVHLGWTLKNGHKLEKTAIQALVKESTSNKPATRRALWGLIGGLILDDGGEDKVASDVPQGLKEFGLALLPALEMNLKAMVGVSPNAPGGVLEGYVAISALLGSIANWASEKAGESSLPSVSVQY